MLMNSDHNGTSKRQRHAGTRTCVGCGARVERRADLLRIVSVPREDGAFDAVVDLRGHAEGRGAWVHARPACVQSAATRGLARAARGRVATDMAALAAQIVAQADRRIGALIGSAHRAKRVAIGADAARAACRADVAPLVVVARDAQAAAKLDEVMRAQARGDAVAWGDKAQLGALVGRQDVGVIAIVDTGIAESLRHAVALAASFEQVIKVS
jgi:predicted RNA-binding protein YlxR (DUF448 family)